jgi:hypothetical protein
MVMIAWHDLATQQVGVPFNVVNNLPIAKA